MLVGRLTRWIVRKNLEEYRSVQPGFFRIYEAGFQNPNVEKMLPANSILVEEAINTGAASKDFDPHQTVNSAGNLLALVNFLLAILAIASEVINIGINSLLIIPYTEIDRTISLALGSTPSIFFVLLGAYFYVVQKDTELVQEMNDELRIPPGPIIGAERDTLRLFKYHVWNTSLSRKSKLPVMSFLILIRLVSEKFYQFAIGVIADNFDDIYQAETKWGAIMSIFPDTYAWLWD